MKPSPPLKNKDIYVLKFKQASDPNNDKFYVGCCSAGSLKKCRKDNKDDHYRISAHYSKSGKTAWCIKALQWEQGVFVPQYSYEDVSPFFEDMVTKKLMQEKGRDNVRGGIYCLRDHTMFGKFLDEELNGAIGSCYICNQIGHQKKQCPYRNDRNSLKNKTLFLSQMEIDEKNKANFKQVSQKLKKFYRIKMRKSEQEKQRKKTYEQSIKKLDCLLGISNFVNEQIKSIKIYSPEELL